MNRRYRKTIIAGNWKMNKTPSETKAFAEQFKAILPKTKWCDIVVCVPTVDLSAAVRAFKDSRIAVGAENVYFEKSGAYTGEISADMLADLGVRYVIVGHSERRALFGETDEIVNKKVLAALEAGLNPIICVGESLAQREMGVTMELIALQVKSALAGVSAEQMRRCVIAYEPIWAIGTGKTATPEQAEEVCENIRAVIRKLYGAKVARAISILYGGSMNDKNAFELLAQPDIDAVTARRSMIRFMKTLKQFFTEQMAELSQQYDQLESQKSSCSYFDFYGFIHTDQERLAQINAQQAELSEQFTALKQSREGIDDNIDPEGIKIRTISELGIAYNNTYVTSESDFIIKNPCVVVRTSDKENIDLALIQLKNKKTPENTYIFKLKGDDSERSFTDKLATLFSSSDDDKLKIDQQLYMIGYNAGLVLANTKQGIKVQMTSGKVTQLSDGQRLLYSIPTLQGSSGSPVIDEYGNLVAVNFAKLGTTDNFNFGIPEESIKEFMRK